MADERTAQLEFHRPAAVRRHANRILNPFIRRKEVRLAQRVLVHVSEGDRVLDVGCGEGSNLWFYTQQRPRCCFVGVDISSEKVAFARGALPDVHAAAADALHLPFKDATFDVVVCRDLLHHVNWNRDGVISDSLRVLKPGGRLVVLEGRGTTVLNRLFSMVFPVERGMRDSTPSSIHALLSRYGDTQLSFVEASSVVRALGFVLGWPAAWLRPVVAAAYLAGSVWEAGVAQVLPQRQWVYMLGVVRRRA
jgi:SAM-dependent methyltransferase